MLKIFVEKLKEEPGTFELNVPPEALDLHDETFHFDDRVRGTIEFKFVGHDIEGKGELHAHAITPCVRCLEPASVDLDVPFDEIWFHRDPDIEPEKVPFGQEEPADFTFSGDTLYPAEAFRELILAELPALPVCRPDCKGLCPGCGANLNHEACTCAPEEKTVEPEAGAPAAEPEWKKKLRQLKAEGE